MNNYKLIENHKGEVKVVAENLTYDEAKKLKKEYIIKYADCNTSYEVKVG